MSFYYQVILKPSDVKFTLPKILDKFDNGGHLTALLDDLESKRKSTKDVPVIEVVWNAEKWEWYTLNNRLLWVFRELEKSDQIRYMAMRRVEYNNDVEEEFPSKLFDESKLVAVVAGKKKKEKRREVHLLSEKLKILNVGEEEEDKNFPEPSDQVKAISHLADFGIKAEEEEHVFDAQSGRQSRSASVCSSVSDGRGKDDWGRTKATSKSGDEIQTDSAQPYLDIENPVFKPEANTQEETLDSIDETRKSVLGWVQDRKKFCKLYSNNYDFQEYVAQNMTTESPELKPTKSLLSIADSAFSDYSTASLSSIARAERKISSLSGYCGYGNFDKYNKEYLSKLREEQLALKRKLKLYDVGSSRNARTRSRLSSAGSEQNDEDLRGWVSRTVTRREERVTQRTYSETVHRRRRSESSCTREYTSHSVSSHISREYSSSSRGSSPRRRRRYSEHDRQREGVKDIGRERYSARRTPCSRTLSRNSLNGSSSSLAASRSLKKKSDSSLQLKLSSVPKEQLYKLWQRRRKEYLKARYSSSVSLASCHSLAVMGYTCGLCFKSFPSRIRLEQHSDELMHWACITCGKFFASHTALGQHIEEVGHRKD